jgi:hypothetical protein
MGIFRSSYFSLLVDQSVDQFLKWIEIIAILIVYFIKRSTKSIGKLCRLTDLSKIIYFHCLSFFLNVFSSEISTEFPINSRFQVINIITCNMILKIHRLSPTFLDLILFIQPNQPHILFHSHHLDKKDNIIEL